MCLSCGRESNSILERSLSLSLRSLLRSKGSRELWADGGGHSATPDHRGASLDCVVTVRWGCARSLHQRQRQGEAGLAVCSQDPAGPPTGARTACDGGGIHRARAGSGSGFGASAQGLAVRCC